MRIIVISGTPGTGKTSVSKKLLDFINAEMLSLNELAIMKRFVIKYDTKRDTYVIDSKKLISYIINKIEKLKTQEDTKFLLIEGHFSDLIPSEYIDYVFVFRCNPYILKERLEKRKYKKNKIIENIQAEILGNCANYMIKKNLKIPVLEIDTSKQNAKKTAQIIVDVLNNKDLLEKYQIGKIDWLQMLDEKNGLNDFF
ncbi:MAG: adenylate kinase family protein [Promethearchaeota archaeon]